MDTWEGHLTPTEVASLTDRASRGRDPNMVKAAAELALSCLAHAQALNPQETKRAMLQCKEQSNKMLEQVVSFYLNFSSSVIVNTVLTNGKQFQML